MSAGPVRRLVAVVPSVGCTNRTVEEAVAGLDGVVHVVHQHGCGQLGGDLAVTREVLVRTCAHPNVVGSVVVGLGCESNQARAMAAAVAAAGGRAEVVVLQEAGGMAPTVDAVRTAVASLAAPPSDGSTGGEVAGRTVGVLADAAAGPAGARLAEAVVVALEAAGAVALRSGPATVAGATVDPVDETQALSLLAVRGAEVTVFVTGRADPTGSPVMPTLKVGVEPAWSGLLGDVLDVDIDPSTDPGASASTVLAALAEVVAGRLTLAERAGQHDFAVPRTAPTM